MSSMNIEGNMSGTIEGIGSGTQKRGFQPVYNKEIEPGDIKMNAVYKSDLVDGVDPAYNKTNKNDIINKEIIEQAETGSMGYGIIGPDAINTSKLNKLQKESNDIEEKKSEMNDNELKEQKRYSPLSTGKWIITLIILCIPVVNVIFLVAWAFGKGNKARQNFCRALLILGLIIGIILSGLLYFVGAVDIVEFFNNMIQEYDLKGYITEYLLK